MPPGIAFLSNERLGIGSCCGPRWNIGSGKGKSATLMMWARAIDWVTIGKIEDTLHAPLRSSMVWLHFSTVTNVGEIGARRVPWTPRRDGRCLSLAPTRAAPDQSTLQHAGTLEVARYGSCKAECRHDAGWALSEWAGHVASFPVYVWSSRSGWM